MSKENFADLLKEMEGDGGDFNPTKIVEGKVVSVSHKKIELDVGAHVSAFLYKADVPVDVEVGDTLNVIVEQLDDGFGNLVINHQEFMVAEQLETIQEKIDNKESLPCRVVSVTKAGLILKVGYLDGFMPGKLVDVVPVNLADFVGKEIMAKVLSQDQTHGNLIMSRKLHITEERGGKVEPITGEINAGDIFNGKVVHLPQANGFHYGAFVDIGGVSALLHVSDYQWDSLNAKGDSLAVGDRIDVMVKSISESDTGKRYWLSMKHLDRTPWEEIKESLPINEEVEATIVKTEDDGSVMVSVAGVPGRIDQKDLSWTRISPRNLKAKFQRGDTLKVMVIGFDNKLGYESVTLSRKLCLPNPWPEFKNNYREGQVVEAEVTYVAANMMFANLEGDIDVMIVRREVSKGGSATALLGYKQGDKIKFVLTYINAQERAVLGSINRLTETANDNKSGNKKAPTIKKGSKLKGVIESAGPRGDLNVSVTDPKTNIKSSGVIRGGELIRASAWIDVDEIKVGTEVDVVVLAVGGRNGLSLGLQVQKSPLDYGDVKNNQLGESLGKALAN